MSNIHAAFVGSIPENYDRYLGPCLFEPYALDIVERLPLDVQGPVLEIACGTGIVTRHLRDRLPKGTKIIATDLNEAMISYAIRKFDANDLIEWKKADAAELPFEDSSFCAVVCQFALMFFPDKAKALQEVRRVLTPGGVFVFNVWDAIEKNDLPSIANQTVSSFFQEDPPVFYQIPFALHDQAVVEELLADASLKNVEATVVCKTGVSPSAADAAKGLVEGNPVIVEIQQRATDDVAVIESTLAANIAAHCGDNPVRGNLQAIVYRATRPAD